MKSNELTSIKSELDCDQKLVERYLEDCETDLSLRKRINQLSKLDSGKINVILFPTTLKSLTKINESSRSIDLAR